MKLNATSSARHRSGESGAFLKEMIMKSVGNEVNVAGGGGEGSLSPKTQLLVVAAVVALGALLIGSARWTLPSTDSSSRATSQTEDEAPAAPPAFEYFPAQYVNQGKEVEEHIEAF
jgi:hypothetical protein